MQAEGIKQLSDIDILKKDIFINLLEIESEIQREELESALFNRAKELGVKIAFNKRLSAYKKEQRKAAQGKQMSAQPNYDFYLERNGKGNIINSTSNYLAIIKNDPMYKGKFALNELTGRPEKIVDGKKEAWTDVDVSKLGCYIEEKYYIFNDKKLKHALRIIFHENRYHPIKDIIGSLKWDGISRIETIIIKWLKVEDTPYSREVSRLIFAGGINRLYNPGCKFDDMAVLIGKNQGEGKSTFVLWLAIMEEFFREIKEIEGQKGIEAFEGGWICEMGELLALTKVKEVEAVKAYITCRVDTYRRPYSEYVTENKRQCIFVGTTNKVEFLTDKTGNRRYYPLICNSKGYELFQHEQEIKAEILQCWAEAKALYDKGELPACPRIELEDAIREAQASAVEDDYREGMIEAYLEQQEKVCIIQIWQKALGNEVSKPTRKDSNDIATILNKMPNWEKAGERTRKFGDYGYQKYWYRKL